MDVQNCCTCRYMRRSAESVGEATSSPLSDYSVECHYSPPDHNGWPRIELSSWCGGYESKDDTSAGRYWQPAETLVGHWVCGDTPSEPGVYLVGVQRPHSETKVYYIAEYCPKQVDSATRAQFGDWWTRANPTEFMYDLLELQGTVLRYCKLVDPQSEGQLGGGQDG